MKTPAHKIQAGDYLVVREKASEKTFLLRASSVDADEVHGILEKNRHLQKRPTSAEKSRVLLNLGSEPPAGKILGIDTTSIYRGSKEHSSFGPVHFFFRPDKSLGKSLFEAMDSVHDILSRKKLAFLVDQQDIVFEIHPKASKYAGMYYPSKKEGEPKRIHLYLNDKTLENASLNSMEYVLLHELGHALHFQYLKPHKEADWVRLFTRSVKKVLVTKQDCEDLLSEVQSAGNLQDTSLEETSQSKLKTVLNWINLNSGLSSREVDILCRSSDWKTVQNVWPSLDIAKKDLAPLVSQYACKSYHELFAESFAFYLLGKELPAKVQSLLEESLSLSRSTFRSSNK